MDVRSAILGQYGESIADFEDCALDNLLAGQELITRDYVRAGVYLLGCAAEMYLKSAYFRFAGNAAADIIGPAELAAARSEAVSSYSVQSPAEAFHSLLFWGLLIVSRRAVEGKPLPTNLEHDLQDVVDRLHANWHISMRYRIVGPGVLAPAAVIEDVMWLNDNHRALWS